MEDSQLDIVNLENGYLGLPPSLQVRVVAVEAVTRYFANPNLESNNRLFWRLVQDIEGYIKSGEAPDA